ncbi:hypothetical protein STCU_08684 [Strigomonas culicis]|uniref:START domain-containing protein n=1 Tax=Strigomonas culicis TaxID=28005 RepID=S9VDL2_9TRYP|nr:hypothetical protein STCU_08684 [Strigomonas culicis]|eukprot:EPY21130.1 hypothetical protein STCU_08684 [Strigomonas culicis]
MVWDEVAVRRTDARHQSLRTLVRTPEDPNGGCTPKEMWDLLQDAVFRIQWDAFRAEAFEIVRLDQTNDIGYYAAKSPMSIVANRDFVNQRMWHDTGRGEYVIFNTSVPHDDVPPTYMKDNKKNKDGSYVRAFSKLTGYLIQPYTDARTGEVTGTALTYITQSDPCGWIPTSVTNYISTKFAPNTIKNVRGALQKFRTWLPEQMANGTYEKGWDLPQPSDWDEGDSVSNETMSFAKAKWLHEMEKEEKKKKKKDHK